MRENGKLEKMIWQKDKKNKQLQQVRELLAQELPVIHFAYCQLKYYLNYFSQNKISN